MKSYFLIIVSALSLANIDTLVEVAVSKALDAGNPEPAHHILMSKAPVKKPLTRS